MPTILPTRTIVDIVGIGAVGGHGPCDLTLVHRWGNGTAVIDADIEERSGSHQGRPVLRRFCADVTLTSLSTTGRERKIMERAAIRCRRIHGQNQVIVVPRIGPLRCPSRSRTAIVGTSSPSGTTSPSASIRRRR